jgi:glycosyltransferase involved in cell wall biosynthesis
MAITTSRLESDMSISVIIPTYKEPEVLDLCLKSAIKNQVQANEIIVVVDGYFDLNKQVLEKYKDHIKVIVFGENHGLARATNTGVYKATQEFILIVNDDNVFQPKWDLALLESYRPHSCIAPNQIEPTPSMFRQFVIRDFGRTPEAFQMEAFEQHCRDIQEMRVEQSGCTLPIFTKRNDFMTVGGWDTDYPGPWVVDWDFFLKCELAGLRMLRTYNCHFYHFVSVGTESSIEEKNRKRFAEQECISYFQYKWGQEPQHDPKTNSKLFTRT